MYSISRPLFSRDMIQIIVSHCENNMKLRCVDMTANVGGDTIMFGLCNNI